MGMFTGLLTLPLAPVRGVVWLGETLAKEAHRQWTDPAAVRAELEQTQRRWEAGEINDAERAATEDELLQRLLAGRPGGGTGHV
ncbi:MAG TPA: gas vesicle protein GvpG [Jatrophihabitans sp.]|jgi:hypothetical protein